MGDAILIPEVRAMRKADELAVMQIEQDAFGEFAWKRFANLLNHQKQAFVVVGEGQVPIAYALLKHDKNPKTINIEKMGVAAGQEGKGVGSLILRWIIVRARLLAVERIALHVRGSNTRAICLYCRTGFKEVGRESNGYKGKGADRVKIAMELEC